MEKGFTLIELLISVFIISILIVTTVIYLNYARQDARDSRRKNDLDKIKSALDLYFNQNEVYPWGSVAGAATLRSDAASWSTTAVLTTAVAPYLSPLPKDPLNKLSGTFPYFYFYQVQSPNLDGFILSATLENPKTDDPNYKIWPATSTPQYNYILRGGTCSQGTCPILSL